MDLRGAGAPRSWGSCRLEVPVSYVKLPPLDRRRAAKLRDPPEAFREKAPLASTAAVVVETGRMGDRFE